MKLIPRLILSVGLGWLTACASATVPPTNLLDVTAPLSPASPSPVVPAANDTAGALLGGQLVFAAERDGRWDVYATSPNGGDWQPLTNDGASRAPAVTRDGAQIAFESRRDGNWEIYTMQSDGARLTRLTRDLAFDGKPTWSPDGKQIAFDSARQGNLGIWVMDANGANPHNLTADSTAVNDAPAWSPDGKWIAFASWRTGPPQIFTVTPDGAQTINLSHNQFDEQSPAWSPDSRQIAFVSNRDGQRAIYVADFAPTGLRNARRITYSGWDDRPAWSPDGKFIAFVSPRPTRQSAYVVSASGNLPRALGDATLWVESVAWANAATAFAPSRAESASGSAPKLLNVAPPTPTSAKLIPLKDVYLAPSYGEMSNQVSGSFEALRARVKTKVGWDFLGTLSDMTRQLVVGQCGDGCDVLSWHKTGRAVDTRLEVARGGVPALEIVREDQLGETYWRLYLRAAAQDGTQGAPLTEASWDWTHQARWVTAPGQGGIEKNIPSGYYVDFTELARAYGWERISSYDDPTLSWKTNAAGMEFWHYQRTDGLVWYAALRELYSPQTLARTFDWNRLLAQKHDEYLLALKGVPAPPGAWRWVALFR